MNAYDCDGVLASIAVKRDKTWGRMLGPERRAWQATLMAAYSTATPLLIPEDTEQFDVITARKPDAVPLTMQWLAKHFPGRVRNLHSLPPGVGRNVENVVNWKATVILANGYENFTEDYRPVVCGIRLIVGDRCRVWHFKSGAMTLA